MLTTPITRLGHPLWSCGMRPFFLATAGAAVLLMLPWLLFLGLGWPVPGTPAGPVAWHAHELLSGMALASVVGFLLTAVPEFTGSAEFKPALVRRLAVLWLLARLAFAASGVGGTPVLLLSAALHLGLLALLVARVAPRLWRDPARAHLAFLWVLLALGVCEAGFHAALLAGGEGASRWLHASLGAYMVLIVVALSRISMRIVNEAVDAAGGPVRYLARPPRRNLAIVTITLFTVAAWWQPGSRVAGWLALAAAAAVFHLLNDWHVGRPLLQRRPLMLYAVYACMGAGYAVMGAGLIGAPQWVGAGRHLLAVGALGLAMLGAMVIAGRAHAGLAADGRAWVPAAVLAIVAAAGVRALPPGTVAWLAAGGLWCAGFGLYLAAMAPVLAAPRADGGQGCRAYDPE